MKLEIRTTDIVKPALSTQKKKSLWRRLIAQWDLQLMVIPSVFLIILFSYIPLWGILTAFQEFDVTQGIAGSPWVGLKQFQLFLSDPLFLQIMRNTLFISLFKLAFGFPAPIILALLLNEVRNQGFKRVIQTISYLPHFMSWVIISGLVIQALAVDDGSVNNTLQFLHVVKEPMNWLSTPQYFWGILVTTGVWKEIGFGAIVYLAAIAGVDPALYEAASIDGAGRFRRMWHITLPSIAPVITILLILSLGQILNAGFEDILLLGGNPVLRDVSEVIDTYVYRTGLIEFRFSFAVAVGLFKSVVNLIVLVIANFVARRLGRSSLW